MSKRAGEKKYWKNKKQKAQKRANHWRSKNGNC